MNNNKKNKYYDVRFVSLNKTFILMIFSYESMQKQNGVRKGISNL